MIAWIVVAGGLLAACTPSATDTNTAANTPATNEAAASNTASPTPEPASNEPARSMGEDIKLGEMPKDGDEVGVIKTNLGTIVVRFFPTVAPKHVENFKDLANKKFYDGLKFHRVIPGFMIQGGDPNSKDNDRGNDGTGGYMENGMERMVPAEFSAIKHVRGVLSMARSQDPNSASSQFFIMHRANEGLDGNYSAFGEVVRGMDVVDKIATLKRDQADNPLPENPGIIESIRIEKWPLGGGN